MFRFRKLWISNVGNSHSGQLEGLGLDWPGDVDIADHWQTVSSSSVLRPGRRTLGLMLQRKHALLSIADTIQGAT